jgi:hypothetical protein
MEGTMREQLLCLGAALIAGILIMILHELPKSIVYCIRNQALWKSKPESQIEMRRNWKNIYKVWHYIDPIGLLLCVTTYSGFSKPYMYRMKDRDTNKISGFVGFLTLLLLAAGSIIILRSQFVGYDVSSLDTSKDIVTILIPFYLFYFIAYLSINMFIVNMFPISTFDMGLLIAGYSPSKYFSIIKSDHFIKMILIFSVLLGIISSVSSLLLDTILYTI